MGEPIHRLPMFASNVSLLLKDVAEDYARIQEANKALAETEKCLRGQVQELTGKLASRERDLKAKAGEVAGLAEKVGQHEQIRKTLHEVIDRRNEMITACREECERFRTMGKDMAELLKRAHAMYANAMTRNVPWSPGAVGEIVKAAASIIGLELPGKGITAEVRTQVKNGETHCSCADCGTAYVFYGGGEESLLYCPRCRA